jgi:hypothetical protein
MFGRNSRALMTRLSDAPVISSGLIHSKLNTKARPVGQTFTLRIPARTEYIEPGRQELLAYQEKLLNTATTLSKSITSVHQFGWLKILHDEFHRAEEILQAKGNKIECSSEEIVGYAKRRTR